MVAISRVLITVALLGLIGFPAARARTIQNPDFSLRALDGPAVTAESLRGEVVVLAFGASWLPLTRTQMEGLKKLADQYAARGVIVYWVSTDSESAKSKNFAADEQLRELGRRYKITVLRDPDGATSKRLGVDQVPATIILNKQGQIAANVSGIDPTTDLAKQLSDRLDKVLQG
ncbi:MAG TPA: TlpA disulfide reductase family protein [Pyrinomonadaceae bacterium]|nr:TlpA disulfide reductase family protein [Pyrinomonadaceae bacterium]